MSTNPARRNAIEAIASQPRLQGSFDFRNEKIDLIYGQNVFSLDKMEKRLPKDVFKSRKASIEAGIKLDARVGLAHRLENYALPNQPSLATPSMDLGLNLEREFGWAKLETRVSLVPSFQSAQNFYVRHETALNIFRGDGPLSLKLGVSNDFRGQPIAGQVRLDTAYFLRAVYAWK